MTTIPLPEINVPEGCEEQADRLLALLAQQTRFLGAADVVEDSGVRSMSTSLEHAFTQGRQVLASAVKRRAKQIL